jgi:hypothetical protein
MLYLYHAVLVGIHRDAIEDTMNESINNPIINSIINSINSIEPKSPLESNGRFPEYIYDIHTGKKRSIGLVTFATEGAFIESECTEYKNDTWRAYYIKFKEMLENPESFLVQKLEKIQIDPQGPGPQGPQTGPQGPQELSIEFLAECPRGQKLTSPSKPFVFIPINQEKYQNLIGFVYKGPYDKKCKRNVIMTHRINILKELGTKNILIPEKLTYASNDWFKFKYLGSIENIKYNQEHDNVSNTDVKIINREGSGIRQLQHYGPNEIKKIIIDNNMIYTLIDMTILHIGDMGLWNILIDSNGKPYAIDFEDTRGFKKNTLGLEYNLLTRSSKKISELLGSIIKNRRPEIIEYLKNRKEFFNGRFNEYFKLIKQDPIETINYLLEKLEKKE